MNSPFYLKGKCHGLGDLGSGEMASPPALTWVGGSAGIQRDVYFILESARIRCHELTPKADATP